MEPTTTNFSSRERTLNQPLLFGEAIAAARGGLMIRRRGWPLGSFVFQQVPSAIPAKIIPNMQSLPPAVKLELAARDTPLFYRDQLALVNGNSGISGWAPSAEDVLADDWQSTD